MKPEKEKDKENEIEAEASGTVVKILAENGKPVTPGQPLLIIKP